MKRFAVVVPALDAEPNFTEFLPALRRQTVAPDRFLVLDSESSDRTAALAREAGAEIVTIPRAEFNHGGTRMRGIDLAHDCQVVVFLTQDAILAQERSLERLLGNFDDERVAVAYGRQLPHAGAGPIERFARLFNYPARSERREKSDIPEFGFKTCFCSNSFAAYRVDRLRAVGGFPTDTIFGEDSLAVARMVLAGDVVRYDADATVLHSHAYDLAQEFRRYFDIGVMHSRSADLLGCFGSTASAGRAYVRGELAYLARFAPLRMPEALLRTMLKYAAYRIGRREELLPLALKRRLSLYRGYWRS